MRRAQDIAQQEQAMGVIAELTSAFEGIASMRISQVKNQVQSSQAFFDELWGIYTQLRADNLFRFGRSQTEAKIIDKELLIVITAEGGFSGDIDQKLINWMLKSYDKTRQDIIVIGYHGAVQLAQRGVSFKKYFKLPNKDQNINVLPLIQEVQQYRSSMVYYQTYVSLMVQDVKRIELAKAVVEKGQRTQAKEDLITEETYIFEPSAFAVVDHLESSMLQIALSQVIFESKLAQYASRFRAMSQANSRADESLGDLRLLLNRASRAAKDERLKEIINGMKRAKAL